MIRFYDRLIQGLVGLAGIVIAAVALIIVYDVAARNLGLQPPASTVALTEYALLYFTMAASPYLVRVKGHIVVEFFYRRFPSRIRRHLDRVILILCALVALTVAVLAGILMLEAIQRGEIEIRSMDTPRWVLFAPLVVGFLLMACEFLRLLLAGDSVFAVTSDQRDSF